MHSRLSLAAAGFLMLASAAAHAAEEHQHAACPAGEAAALPDELASWNDRAPLKAATQSGKLGPATLTVGSAVDATLAPTPDVKYAVRPEKPGSSVSYGGLFAFTVEQTGNYRVALGTAAWIDIVRDGETIESIAHGHGPECSGVRKMVDFPLEAGGYTLQIAANGQPELPLLVTRLP